MQVASRLRALHAPRLWHGRVNAETVLLRGPSSIQLLGACALQAAEQPNHLWSSVQKEDPPDSLAQGSLNELESMWCARKVIVQLA